MSKYIKKQLEPIVKESLSFAEVIRKLGLKQGGGTQNHLIKAVESLGIDYSHFLGQALGRGKRNKGAFKEKSWEEILTYGKKGAHLLRRALVQSGREYLCEACGQDDEWNGKVIVLQVDHKNGDHNDNNKENIRFLCPNCHSQTDNFAGKGIKKILQTFKCKDCDKEISKRHERCKSCSKKMQPTKIKWPCIENLLDLIKNNSYEGAGRILGVSSNAIRKRIKNVC